MFDTISAYPSTLKPVIQTILSHYTAGNIDLLEAIRMINSLIKALAV